MQAGLASAWRDMACPLVFLSCLGVARCWQACRHIALPSCARHRPHACAPPTVPAGAPATPDQEPDVQVVTRVSGPEPGYIACSVFIVQVNARDGGGRGG